LTNKLILWPFLHSWVAGAFLAIFGAGIEKARLASLIFLLPSVLLLFAICRRIFPENGGRIGLLAAILFASSPLILFFSATCMVEMLGTFLGLAFFWAYFSAIGDGKKIFYLLAGLFLALLYLSKYNYGLLLLACVGADVFIQFWFEEKGRRASLLLNTLIIVVTFSAAVGIWIAAGESKAKFEILSYYFKGGMGGGGLKISGLDRALFYIRSLANIYTFSIWVFFIFLGGIIFDFFHLRKRKLRLVLLTILIILITCSIGKNEQDRYIILAFTQIAVSGAALLVFTYQKIKPGWPRRSAFGILILLIAADAFGFPDYCRRVANHTVSSPRYPAHRGLGYSVLFVPGIYPGILKQSYNNLNPDADFAAAEHSAQDIWNFIYNTMRKRGSLCCLSTFQEFSPHLRRWYSFEFDLPVFSYWEPRCAFFASVEIEPDSPHFNKEYRRSFLEKNHQWIHFLQQLDGRDLIKLIGTRSYSDLNVTVRVYRKTPKFEAQLNGVRSN